MNNTFDPKNPRLHRAREKRALNNPPGARP